MKILFLNTWHGKLRDPLVEYVKSLFEEIDIFCFQEVYESRRLFSVLFEGFEYFNGDKLYYGKETFSNETFVKPHIEILEKELLTLDDEEIGLGVYTKIKHNHNSFHLCNYHGAPRPGNKKDTPQRLRQSEKLIKYFEDKKRPVIIGGDFNLDMDTKSVKMFEKAGYRNLIKDFKIKATRNKVAWHRFPGSKQKYADYVFVSQNVDVIDFKVVSNEVSDHLPMILDCNL